MTTPLMLRPDNQAASFKLTPQQIEAKDELLAKIHDGRYKLIDNKCLCGSTTKDTELAKQDRYGLPFGSILCNKCGLVRTSPILNDQCILEFYAKDYRKLYLGNEIAPSFFFSEQLARGKRFLSLCNKLGITKSINTVFEIGCGAGGVLFPFFNEGKNTAGCDYDTNYLALGNSKGLNLSFGDYREKMDDAGTDLVILSHVLEHFNHPLAELEKILKKIKPNGYLLLEVPGLFEAHLNYSKPIIYFQGAHIYNFTQTYLEQIFKNSGVEIIYGDEGCTFVIKKTGNQVNCPTTIPLSKELNEHARQVERYLNHFQKRSKKVTYKTKRFLLEKYLKIKYSFR